ncbi:MAG TPA: DotU family type IV/VI secretion system protein [Planctomicrobium sp.]|nr:DotU family type IV/VI secretion system protein [Planctomicrobium sp.]
MNPRFATAVDPVFLYVIRLIDRIENREEPVAREEFNHLRRHFETAEAALGQSKEWLLAKYALVSWIDELLIFAEWRGRDWWENNTLETELFRTREASTQFFVKAREAGALETRNALEIYYICIVLGFYGIYRTELSLGSGSERGSHFLQDLGLPPTRELWARQTKAALQLQQGRPSISVDSKPGDAPPLEEKFECIASWLVTLVLAVSLFFVSFYLFGTVSGPGS